MGEHREAAEAALEAPPESVKADGAGAYGAPPERPSA
jgi:hypothetical protein